MRIVTDLGNIEGKIALVHQVNAELRLPLETLTVILEGEVLGLDPHAESPFRDLGWYHRAAEIRAEGIRADTPADVRRALADDATDHIIWISKTAIMSDAERFCWIYSHEFGHFKQKICPQDYKAAKRFLENRYQSQTELPADLININHFIEYDADLTAKFVVERIFGMDAADRYLADYLAIERGDDYCRKLLLHEAKCREALMNDRGGA